MKRYIYTTILLVGFALMLQAQITMQSNIMTETMLDNTGNRWLINAQYFDGLGRLEQEAQTGINPSGKGIYTMTNYDANGRPCLSSLPIVGNSGCGYLDFWDLVSLPNTYQDSPIVSQTTYDALDRPTFVSTPGQNWTGKGKSISYITNAANSVKKYTGGTTLPLQQGYYPAGSLTGEVQMDEDSITVTTYKDLMGRVVLERRGENDDTYYVYYNNGLLHFILQPMFQESSSFYYRFRYDYDTKGRLTAKYLPGSGSNPIRFWYDPANRIIAEQDSRLSSGSRYRFYLYDSLGRLCVQGNCTAFTQLPSAPVTVTRSSSSGTYQVCNTGYYVSNAFTLTSPEIEIVNYYDDYSFLATSICSALTGSNNFSLSSPFCATSLLTGSVTATSDGNQLLSVNYYDQRGRIIDTRQTLLNGDFLQSETTYSFTDKPLTVLNTLTANGRTFEIDESYAYSQQTDQLTACDVSYNDTTVRVNSFTYDNLGRLSDLRLADNHFCTFYSYNLHGWLTSAYTTKLINGYQYLFTQDLYYETGNGTPCYNGNISSMKWRTNSDTYGHGFKFTYDKRNRLTEAGHTLYDMSTYPICYSEAMTYNRNSAITSLTRTSNGQGYGNIDQLTYTYTGNRLKAIADAALPNVYNGGFEFVNGSNLTQEYWYNNAGDLTRDKNKGIALINYDLSGHPMRVQFTNGNQVDYVYAADGRKLREKHTTAIDGLTVSYGQTMELTPAQIMVVDSVDYAANLVINAQQSTLNNFERDFDYHFDGGYLSIRRYSYTRPNVPLITEGEYTSHHYFIHDYQGNNRVVVAPDGTVEQENDYYAYGGPWGNTSTNQGFQPFKYNGKELDRVHGLDWYDYGARRYDPAFAQFTQMDPLCEKYPHFSPYAYCAGNPVRYVDPDGRHIRVTRNEDGSYEVTDVIVDGDLNIYDVSGGWENRVSIGEAMTQHSFTNDDGSPVEGSVIDLNDKSGQEFWNNFQTWAPFMPLAYYAFNAYKGQKYDFKRQGEPYPGTNDNEEDKENQKYHNRGMKLNIDGKEYIASGRDIGNYAAGYIAGLHGLTWQEARCGFDALESIQLKRITAEKKPSQSAQLKGFTNGWKTQGMIRRLLFNKLLVP